MLSEANILICYMPKTELRMQSYSMMKMGTWIRVSREKVNPRRYFHIWIARGSRFDEGVAGVLAGLDEGDGGGG